MFKFNIKTDKFRILWFDNNAIWNMIVSKSKFALIKVASFKWNFTEFIVMRSNKPYRTATYHSRNNVISLNNERIIYLQDKQKEFYPTHTNTRKMKFISVPREKLSPTNKRKEIIFGTNTKWVYLRHIQHTRNNLSPTNKQKIISDDTHKRKEFISDTQKCVQMFCV